jgi:alcohol dehydrogenase YqhD (iron-dependent ADH family)
VCRYLAQSDYYFVAAKSSVCAEKDLEVVIAVGAGAAIDSSAVLLQLASSKRVWANSKNAAEKIMSQVVLRVRHPWD